MLRVGGVPEHFNFAWRQRKDVVWKEFKGGSGDLANALQTGSLDVALMLTEAAVASVTKGSPFRILGAYTSSPLVWGVHTSASTFSGGDRFAVSRMGSGSHLMSLVDASTEGRELPTEFVVVGSLEGARAALKEGRADKFMWEKFMTKPLVDSGEWNRISEVPTPWPAFSIVVSDTLDEFDHLLHLLESVRTDNLNLSTRIPEISRDYDLDENDVRAWLDTVSFCCRPEIKKDTLDFVSATLVNAGVIEKSFTYEQLTVAGVTRDRTC